MTMLTVFVRPDAVVTALPVPGYPTAVVRVETDEVWLTIHVDAEAPKAADTIADALHEAAALTRAAQRPKEAA